MLSNDEITLAYKQYLGRQPENNSAIEYIKNKCTTSKSLAEHFTQSEEYKNKHAIKANSPFWFYAASFDAIETIKKFAKKNIAKSHLHVTNFLGVKIRPVFIPTILNKLIGTIESEPIPANWHADIAEWASVLHAVELSGTDFVMIELGCGWGCWMTNSGIAAKSIGKKIKLYGIEADERHLNFAKLALQDNLIGEDEYSLHRGIAGKKSGIVLFPTIESGTNWGGTAIFNPSNDQINQNAISKNFSVIQVLDIANLLENEVNINLMHIDIQGAELDLLIEIYDFLCVKVNYIFIGTHSRSIEAGLFELFKDSGFWKLEVERPCTYDIVDGQPVLRVDGVQAWRNSLMT